MEEITILPNGWKQLDVCILLKGKTEVENAIHFREKIAQGKVCLGATITFNDPTATECLCGLVDFLWIDIEHNPMSLETLQGHIMATKGTRTAPIVRIPKIDEAFTKPVLDMGAAGIIAPNVKNAQEAARFVALCLYPPEGIRGYGPRRPSQYERAAGPDFCRKANKTILTFTQIESLEAVNDIDNILAVPNLSGICFGPNDLSGSMGLTAQGGHPKVLQAVETCVEKAKKAGLLIGFGCGSDVQKGIDWVKKGAHWMQLSNDYAFMYEAAEKVCTAIRNGLGE